MVASSTGTAPLASSPTIATWAAPDKTINEVSIVNQGVRPACTARAPNTAPKTAIGGTNGKVSRRPLRNEGDILIRGSNSSAHLTFSCDSFSSEAAAALAATAYQKMNLMTVTSFLMLGLIGPDY